VRQAREGRAQGRCGGPDTEVLAEVPGEGGGVKERGILFSGPLVKALPVSWEANPAFLIWRGDDPLTLQQLAYDCPYGMPGDRLWVRETWYDDMHGELADTRERQADGRAEGIEYRASHNCAAWEAGCPCNPDGDGKRSEWRPSIYMPRWASRITLEVTEVRVQRLNEISEEDAKAEGVTFDWVPAKVVGVPAAIKKPLTHRHAFAALWDEINGKKAPWASNSWCWAISFRRLP
jgi:hypothetical protein